MEAEWICVKFADQLKLADACRQPVQQQISGPFKEVINRVTLLKSKIDGPYADLSTIQAGDWLYFINYSFKESDHSGIFVDWTDSEKTGPLF